MSYQRKKTTPVSLTNSKNLITNNGQNFRSLRSCFICELYVYEINTTWTAYVQPMLPHGHYEYHIYQLRYLNEEV